MLVLTRKMMQSVFIGDDICVTVVRLESGQVRLGIEAPREVSVVRAELVPERPTPHPLPVRDGYRPVAVPNVRRSPCVARGSDSRYRGRSR